MNKREQQACKFICSKYLYKSSVNVVGSAWYRNRTHVESLEGYYATTTPEVLVYKDSDCRKHYGFKPFWSKVFLKLSNQTSSSASFWNQTHVTCLEVCYATTTWMMLGNSHMEEGEHQGCTFFCNQYHCKIFIIVIASESYGNRTHVNSLEGY